MEQVTQAIYEVFAQAFEHCVCYEVEDMDGYTARGRLSPCELSEEVGGKLYHLSMTYSDWQHGFEDLGIYDDEGNDLALSPEMDAGFDLLLQEAIDRGIEEYKDACRTTAHYEWLSVASYYW